MFAWCGNSKKVQLAKEQKTKKTQEKESSGLFGSISTNISSPSKKTGSMSKIENEENGAGSFSSRISKMAKQDENGKSRSQNENKSLISQKEKKTTLSQETPEDSGEAQKAFFRVQDDEIDPMYLEQQARSIGKAIRELPDGSARLDKFREAVLELNKLPSANLNQCIISSLWFYECFVNSFNGRVIQMPINNWVILEKIIKREIKKADYEVITKPMYVLFEVLFGGGPLIEIPAQVQDSSFKFLSEAFREKLIKETGMTESLFQMHQLMPKYLACLRKEQEARPKEQLKSKDLPTLNQGLSKKSTEDETFTKMKGDDSQVEIEALKNQHLVELTQEIQMRLPAKGIENPSNYCYLNAILQALVSTPGFVPSILASQSTFHHKRASLEKDSAAGTPSMLQRFSEFFKEYAKFDSRTSIDNSVVRDLLPHYMRTGQQDAHECLLVLLSSLQDALTEKDLDEQKNQSKFELRTEQDVDNYLSMFRSSFVDRLFLGRYNASFKCKSCKAVSFNFDPFIGISLSLGASSSNVKSLLKSYFKAEVLSYSCESCKKSTQATKTLKVARFPKILVLHIKRFVYKPEMQKINKEISFPKIIDLKEYHLLLPFLFPAFTLIPFVFLAISIVIMDNSATQSKKKEAPPLHSGTTCTVGLSIKALVIPATISLPPKEKNQ